MDVCSAEYKADSESKTCFCESSKETLGCASGNPGGPFVKDLGHHFTESLNIEDDENSVYKDNSDTLKEDGSAEFHTNDCAITDTEKGLNGLIKSATFPCSGIGTTPLSGRMDRKGDTTAEVLARNADAKSSGLPYSRSISLPTPLKVVSAIKGSREKLGRPPMKLSVTWAPDVYDPIPTSVSHVPRNGRHRSDNKRNGKYKQKSNGKSSRGSKGKDRKQSRKHGGSTKRSYYNLEEDNHFKTCSSFQPLEDNIMAGCSSGLQARAVDFDIGSTPDQFCGSSFLKKSVAKLHFQVAEAT